MTKTKHLLNDHAQGKPKTRTEKKQSQRCINRRSNGRTGSTCFNNGNQSVGTDRTDWKRVNPIGGSSELGGVLDELIDSISNQLNYYQEQSERLKAHLNHLKTLKEVIGGDEDE